MSTSGIESSNIASHALFFTNQIEVTFADDIGNRKLGKGTGFWVDNGESHYFVTNAHNIDPRMIFGAETSLRLQKLKIRLKNGYSWLSETAFCEVKIDGLKQHKSADVAVIKNPIDKQDRFLYGCFSHGDIANEQFFRCLNVMDNASFIGFPGEEGRAWYDDSWNLAIARTVNIASHPAIPF